MDKRCKSCKHVCKRLDADDAPVAYFYANLGPDTALLLTETLLKLTAWRHGFSVEQSAYSCGPQLSLVLQVAHPLASFDDTPMVLVALAQFRQETHTTQLCFRYGPPEAWCAEPSICAEFHAMMGEVLNGLSGCDGYGRAAAGYGT